MLYKDLEDKEQRDGYIQLQDLTKRYIKEKL